MQHYGLTIVIILAIYKTNIKIIAQDKMFLCNMFTHT